MDKKEPDFTQDPHWGKGGRYIVNAEGKRVPAPPAEDAVAPAGEAADGQELAPVAGESKPVAEADHRKTMKEKQRA